MRAYSSMPLYEFIEELRFAAIRNRASPAVLDKIDELLACPSDDEKDEACTASFDEGVADGLKQARDCAEDAINFIEEAVKTFDSIIAGNKPDNDVLAELMQDLIKARAQLGDI